MGVDDGCSGDSSSNSNETQQVILNVYDLTPVNNYVAWFGFGIFHSGIEVYGREYGFGAHAYPISGVFEVEPKSFPRFIYRCSVPLGRIDMPPSEFWQFIETVASEYHGNTYHFIYKNCNHFANDMSTRLTGKKIPGWVNRLAKLGAVCSCLFPESLPETSVKHMLEYHSCSDEDVSESPSINMCQELTKSEDSSYKDNKHLLSLGARLPTIVGANSK